MICYSSGESMRILQRCLLISSVLFFLTPAQKRCERLQFCCCDCYICLCVKHSVCECLSRYSEQNGRYFMVIFLVAAITVVAD